MSGRAKMSSTCSEKRKQAMAATKNPDSPRMSRQRSSSRCSPIVMRNESGSYPGGVGVGVGRSVGGGSVVVIAHYCNKDEGGRMKDEKKRRFAPPFILPPSPLPSSGCVQRV